MKINLPVTGNERRFDESARIISTTDPKGIITGYNQTFFDISGFDANELDHKNHNVVRHPEMPPAAFAGLWQTVKQGKSWMGIVKNRCKNGDHYWVDAFVTPITDGNQTIEYQSVRSKPCAERVARAEQAYQRINAGKKPFRKGASLLTRLMLCYLGALTIPLAVELVAPQFEMIALIASFGIAAGLFYWQMAPVRQMATESKHTAEDPLMQYVYTGRTDELGQIQLSSKMYASQLDAVVSRLNYATDALEVSAKESSQIAQKAGDCIRQQQNATQEINTSMTEMSASIQQVAQNATETAQSAREANIEAESSRDSVINTVESINELGEDIVAAAGIIERLAKESQSISGVLDVIREVAEQTNMLALNAAIEAARAGEQGRGFSVVADEVRALAGRTQKSIQEIEKMVSSIQKRANEGTEAMQSSCEKVRNTCEQTQAITVFLDQISHTIQTIDDMTAQIAAATEQQQISAEHIRNNVEALYGQTLQAVEVAGDNDLVSQNLAQHTQQLKTLVRQFQ